MEGNEQNTESINAYRRIQFYLVWCLALVAPFGTVPKCHSCDVYRTIRYNQTGMTITGKRIFLDLNVLPSNQQHASTIDSTTTVTNEFEFDSDSDSNRITYIVQYASVLGRFHSYHTIISVNVEHKI